MPPHLDAAFTRPRLTVSLALDKDRLTGAAGARLPAAIVTQPHKSCPIIARQSAVIDIESRGVEVHCAAGASSSSEGGRGLQTISVGCAAACARTMYMA
jgi:hypothetical protein